MEQTVRSKWNCMHLGTGLCPKGEMWRLSSEECDGCKYYLTREGETNDRPADEVA